MQSIEENTERLDLLHKTLELEIKQKKRLMEISSMKQREIADASRTELYEGLNSTTNSMLCQEEAHRKELVDVMVQNSNSSNGPVVKVLNNVQGK